jgi:hypothetical protein
MDRRHFLSGSLAVSAAARMSPVTPQSPAGSTREFYQIRRYGLRSGPQLKLTEAYFNNALIPALGRMGQGPIGAFKLDFGPETPTFILVIPGPSAGALVEMELRLRDDEEFLRAAAPFWNAPNTEPAFLRVEVSLLAAFLGWPKLTPPAAAPGKTKRIFQLRTYESPSDRDHARKVEMFHSGEFEIFKAAGFHPVFFGDTLIGTRLPNLTYMLSFSDLAELEAKWDVFRNDIAWKKLSADPRFAFEPIVDNITNLVLSPLDCSQI